MFYLSALVPDPETVREFRLVTYPPPPESMKLGMGADHLRLSLMLKVVGLEAKADWPGSGGPAWAKMICAPQQVFFNGILASF